MKPTHDLLLPPSPAARGVERGSRDARVAPAERLDDAAASAPCKGVGKGVRRIVAAARKLRRTSTDMERKLWHRIRDKQIEAFRFRRQRPIGKYIVDFICLEAKLIVELDGGQHAESVLPDEKRTVFLESLGYHVVRFWNNEVLENMDGVLARIREHLLGLHQPHPSPPLGRGGSRLYEREDCRSDSFPRPAGEGWDGGVCTQNEDGPDTAKDKK